MAPNRICKTSLIFRVAACLAITTALPADETMKINGSEVITLRDLLPTCRRVEGLLWCYNDAACGQACNDVCAAMGSEPIDDNTVWFEAQNTSEKCQALADAFGMTGSNLSAGFTFACLEDTSANPHPVTGLNGDMQCSGNSSCPANHRAGMDNLGVDCTDGQSRRSICPCKGAVPVFVP